MTEKHPAFEGDIVTDQEWDAALQAMRTAGRKAGENAGTWVADGNTDERTLRRMLAQMEDCEWDNGGCSGPFSGEWAGDPSVEDVIDAETDVDAESLTPEERDDLATAFEDEFWVGYSEEAERTVRNFLGDDE